jgi:hypothetical protein
MHVLLTRNLLPLAKVGLVKGAHSSFDRVQASQIYTWGNNV